MESPEPSRPTTSPNSPIETQYRLGDEVVPGYTLVSQLGSGMAGDVWIAQAAGGVQVALKVIRSLAMVGGRKELRALKTIRNVKHPNLCPVFGFWTKDEQGRILADGETELLSTDTVDFVLPRREQSDETGAAGSGKTMSIGVDATPVDVPAEEGASAGDREALRASAQQLIVVMGLGDRTLYDRLLEVRREAGIPAEDSTQPLGLPPSETIRYLRAAAGAIDLLNHEHQIYHCDIKPQNILIVGGDAQVCDFGLANKIEGDMRTTQQAFATPAYAAPEVLQGQTYSRSVDQYSLAVTYFELRTGLLPFDITTQANMVVAKCTGKLDLSRVSPGERKVLARAMEVDPTRRYSSCTDFITALARATGVDQGGGVSPRKLAAGVAASVLVLALAVAGWRWVDPDGFADAVASLRGGRTAEQELADARRVISDSADVAYMTRETGLSEAAKMALSVLEDRKAETRDEAAQLSDKAISLLNEKIRLTLLDESGLNERDLAFIENDLRWMDDELSKPEPDFAARERLLLETWLNQTLLDQKHRGAFDTDAAGRLAATLESGPNEFSDPADRLEAAFAVLLARIAQAGIAVESIVHSDPESVPDGRTAELPVSADEPLRQSLIACEKLVDETGLSAVPAFYRNLWPPLRDASLASMRQFVADADRSSPEVAAVMSAFPRLAAEAELSAAHRALAGRDLDQVREHLGRLDELDQSASNPAMRSQRSWLRDVLTLLSSERSLLPGLRRLAESGGGQDLRSVPQSSLDAAVAMVVEAVNDDSPSLADAMDLQRSVRALADKTGTPTEAADLMLLTAAISADALSDQSLDPLLQEPNLDPSLRPLTAAIRLERLARDGQRPPQTKVRQLHQVIAEEGGLAATADRLPAGYDALVNSAADVLLGDLNAAVERLETVRQKVGNGGNRDAEKKGGALAGWSDARRGWVAERYLEYARQQSGVEDHELRHRYAGDQASLAVWVERAGQWLGEAAASDPDWIRERTLVELSKPARDQNLAATRHFEDLEPAELSSPMLHGLLMVQLGRCKPSAGGGTKQREAAIVRLVDLAGEKVQRLSPRQKMRLETAHNFFAPIMEQFSVLIRRSNGAVRQLDPRVNTDAARAFCAGMLESARSYEVEQSFRETGDPGPWYADLETAAAVAAALDDHPQRSSTLWLEAAEYYRKDKDLQADRWTSVEDVLPLEQYIERARAAVGDTPNILLEMALASERRSKVVVNNDDRVAALDRASALCQQAVDAIDDESNWLVEKFDSLWNHANILVQRAFYHASDRAEMLERAREKASLAIRMTESYPDESQEWSTAAAYSALGNACEDLGFYCYTASSDQLLRMERFEQACEAFREAVKLTRGSGGFKESLYLARCLIRHHEHGGPEALLDEAEAHLREPSDDLPIDLRARSGLWRSVLAQRRKDQAAALQFAEGVFELLRNETAPRLLDESNDAAIHYADLLYKTDADNASQVLDIISTVQEPSPRQQWKSLAIRMLVYTDLGDIEKSLACYDEMLRSAQQDLSDEPDLVIPLLGAATLDLLGFTFPRGEQLDHETTVERLSQAAQVAAQAGPTAANDDLSQSFAEYAGALRGLVDGTETRPAIAGLIDAIDKLPEGEAYERLRTEGRWNLWYYFGLACRSENPNQVIAALEGDAVRLAEQLDDLQSSDAINAGTRRQIGSAINGLRQ